MYPNCLFFWLLCSFCTSLVSVGREKDAISVFFFLSFFLSFDFEKVLELMKTKEHKWVFSFSVNKHKCFLGVKAYFKIQQMSVLQLFYRSETHLPICISQLIDVNYLKQSATLYILPSTYKSLKFQGHGFWLVCLEKSVIY